MFFADVKIKAMKKIIFFAVLIIIAASYPGCKKNHKSEALPSVDTLYEASLVVQSALENEPDINVGLNDVVLPNTSHLFEFELAYDHDWLVSNKFLLPAADLSLLDSKKAVFATGTGSGQGPQAIKNIIIARAQIAAYYLTTASNFASLVKNKPAPEQTKGLAYVYGSHDFTKLNRSAGACPELLYGLDCSGMLMYLMAEAGINVSGNAADLSKKNLWEDALVKAGAAYSNLQVQSFSSSQMPLSQIQTGDIIYFYGTADDGTYGVKHIGMALNDPSGNLMLYQSNGRSSKSCELNYDGRHGPRRIGVTDPITQKGWGFSDYGVIRLVAKIAGKWNAYIRCQNASSDAITLNLNFPVIEGGAYQATGSGSDYDGSPINVVINGNYDVAANDLNGTIFYSFPNDPQQKRSDSFDIVLNYDDTGYTPLTKINDNGGCSAQLRLVNQQTAQVNQTGQVKVQSLPVKCNCGIGHPTVQ
ncbi:NlpC/P60 family protein [Mucilaginibacter oryzae]|uniref:NlpC/P60 family protein n=1 Tax=Mucilaginibacter oryzae TaxID=468058 RepID=A0A316GS86_9SPHI|nr:NlpC/P60 family protein [Mucilaginibacter oryzae]PWK65769.1 NlpC/P60 family protein [Mucilaginibacter oryzae]